MKDTFDRQHTDNDSECKDKSNISFTEKELTVHTSKNITENLIKQEISSSVLSDISNDDKAQQSEDNEELVETVSQLQRSASDKIEKILKTIKEVEHNLDMDNEQQIPIEEGLKESHIQQAEDHSQNIDNV